MRLVEAFRKIDKRVVAGIVGTGAALVSVVPAFAQTGFVTIDLEPVTFSRSEATGYLIFGPDIPINQCPALAKSFSFRNIQGDGQVVDFNVLSAQLSDRRGQRVNNLTAQANAANGHYQGESILNCYSSLDGSDQPILTRALRFQADITD